MASRRYRQKKKVLLEQLESKLEDMVAQKQKLEQEHQETLQTLTKLKQENATLRKEQHKESEEVEKKRLLLLQELDRRYKNNATDEELTEIMKQLNECCKKITLIGESHAQMLINPTVITELVKAGFFEGRSDAVLALERQASVRTFKKRIEEHIKGLTIQQIERMNKAVDDYEDDMKILGGEKEHLNNEIVDYFKKTSEQQGTDMAKLVNMVGTLEHFRKNVHEEVKRTELALEQLLEQLSPRQIAQFQLDVEFWHNSVIQLKMMWDAFAKKPSVGNK